MRKLRKALALLLAVVLALGLLGGCKANDGGSQGSQDNTSGVKDSTSDPGTSGSEDENKVSPNLEGVDNELTMKLEGEVDKSKTLTTLVDVDASPAFNGNPFDETAGLNWSVQPFLYDYLAFFTPMPDRQFKLSMMESYDYTDKILTIKLLPNLKWSDGSTLDAEDVLTNFYCDIGRSTVWSYLDAIEKVDDLTLRLEFCKESPLLLNITFRNPIRTPDELFGEWAQQYRRVAETQRVFDEETQMYRFTDEGNERLAEINQELLAYKPSPDEVIGCGPYLIDKYNTSEILFKANAEYRKEVLISSIRGLRPGDSQAFATAILAGEYTMENGGLNVDMSREIDNKYSETLRKVFVPEMSQIGYTFNTQAYPLDQVEVRRAISMAVDRQSLLAVSEPGSFDGSKYNAGILPSLMDTYVDDEFLGTLNDYDYNPDGAAALLESIGWTKQGGKWVDPNGESPVISIGTINSWPTFMMTGEAMSQMLSDFGFNIEFKPMEFGVWNDFTKTDEKMIVCTFVGGASSYASPWECFNDLFNANSRTGWQKVEAGQDKIFTDSNGKEYNVTTMLNEMYGTDDEARMQELVREFMTLSNDLCGYISVVEKAAPLRVYDTSLSMPETEMNAVQRNPVYYDNINTMIVKMLQDDVIYFVK